MRDLKLGAFKNNDNTFTAVTYSQSKTFKTLVGASKWLKKRGFDVFGGDL